VACVWCGSFAPASLLLLLPTTAAGRDVGRHGLDDDDECLDVDGARVEKALPSWKAHAATQRLAKKDFMADANDEC
jgi:hypothetical protein